MSDFRANSKRSTGQMGRGATRASTWYRTIPSMRKKLTWRCNVQVRTVEGATKLMLAISVAVLSAAIVRRCTES